MESTPKTGEEVVEGDEDFRIIDTKLFKEYTKSKLLGHLEDVIYNIEVTRDMPIDSW
jgi:hypothetical protein